MSAIAATTEPPDLPLRSFPAFAFWFLLLTALACGGDNLVLPRDGEPARIAIARGNDQRGTVGRPLDDSLVAEVTDSDRRPVEGVAVVFTPPPGGAVEPNDTVLTDANGEAAVYYTLSTTAGDQMVEARAIPIVSATSSTIMFKASAEPEGAVELRMAGGDNQTAEVLTPLPESLAVRAVDRFGNGVAGIEVAWDAKGGGEVSPGTVITGSDGRAATQRMLGDRPGSYPATASVDGLEGSPVSFTARAIAAPQPALALVTQPSSSARAGVSLERQPVLQLQDPFGAPLSREDVRVTVQIASGGGSLGGETTARSDGSGRVSFGDLELRGRTGSRTLIFAAEGFIPVTSAAISVGPGPPAQDQSSVSVPNGTAGATTNVSVHLEDEFGNAITGAAELVSVAVEGANPSGSLPISEVGEGSYSAAYVPVRAGTDQVSVRVSGESLGGSPFPSIVVAGPADPATTTAVLTRSGFFGTTLNAVVTTRDANGNLLARGGDHVQVQWNDLPPQDATDHGDGNYSRSDFLGFGTVAVTIYLNGVPIAGSPFVL